MNGAGGAGAGAQRPAKRPRTAQVTLENVQRRVTNAGVIRRVQHRVLTLSKARNSRNDKLPGPLAVTLSRSSLAKVISAMHTASAGRPADAVKQGYWVCEKSDGERAMLFCSHRCVPHGCVARGRMRMCCVGCGPCAETDTTTAHSPKNAYLLNRSFVVSSLDGGEALANALAVKGDTLLDGELLLELGALAVHRCPPPSLSCCCFSRVAAQGVATSSSWCLMLSLSMGTRLSSTSHCTAASRQSGAVSSNRCVLGARAR